MFLRLNMQRWTVPVALALVCFAGVALFGVMTRGFAAVTSDGVRRLDIARVQPPLPAIALVDSRGKVFSLANPDPQQRRTTVITLVYTQCVAICRSTVSGQAYLQQQFRERRLGQRVRLLTISFDPVRDTPAVLGDYARKMNADPALWTVATVADPADLARLLRVFEIVVLPDGRGDYVHNGAIFIVDERARLVRAYDVDRPDQVLADLIPD